MIRSSKALCGVQMRACGAGFSLVCGEQMRGCGAGFESRVWRTDEGVVQPRVQHARPDDDDEHEQEGVDVAEEVERRDARLWDSDAEGGRLDAGLG